MSVCLNGALKEQREKERNKKKEWETKNVYVLSIEITT